MKTSKKLTIDHNNGHKSVYNLWYEGKELPIAIRDTTPDKLANELLRAYRNDTRVKVYLGNPETGKPWNEEYDNSGYIGMSKGYEAFFLILVNNKRSSGGRCLMEDNIIKMKETGKDGKVLYQAENFQPSTMEIKEENDLPGYTHSTYLNGELFGRHKNIRSAEICVRKVL